MICIKYSIKLKIKFYKYKLYILFKIKKYLEN